MCFNGVRDVMVKNSKSLITKWKTLQGKYVTAFSRSENKLQI